ncbi:tripartite tricarboxylate transporter TctB family protein [Nesterenkonia halobia]|uniref:Tripartite tricarboxylate transporter TctB family protein n=1 Tax=Nesterenkonia halobia TaxID=37922 RepID=A0ABP6RGV6_9MICC
MTSRTHESGRPARGALGTRIAAVVILAVAAVVLTDAVRIAVDGGFGPSEPGFFPLIVGVGLAVFGTAFLLRTTAVPDLALREQAGEEHATTHWRTLWSVIGGLVAYAVLLEPLGYILATSLFFLAVNLIAGSRRWVRTIIIAVLLATVLYLGFTELLGVRLPVGPWGE